MVRSWNSEAVRSKVILHELYFIIARDVLCLRDFLILSLRKCGKLQYYFVEKLVLRLISVLIRHVFGLRADEVLLVTADQNNWLTKITEGSEKDNNLAAFGKGSVMPSESNSSSGKNVKTNAGVSYFRAFHSTLALFSHNIVNWTSILLWLLSSYSLYY